MKGATWCAVAGAASHASFSKALSLAVKKEPPAGGGQDQQLPGCGRLRRRSGCAKVEIGVRISMC
jgi:hypothetical protein